MRCTTGRPSLRGRAPGSPSRSTSKCSTTAGACTRPWATAPHTTRSPTTELRQPPQRDQPEDLSKILDTAHHPGDPLVVHPLLGRGAVVELGGDPRRPVGPVAPVLGVHRPDPLRELVVGRRPGSPARGGVSPGVERRPGDPHDLTQPLHLEGVPVVGDELEAGHQRVSPAKYLAAARRMSRSLFNFRASASSSATRDRSRASSCSGVSSPGIGGADRPAGRRYTSTPAAFNHADNVESMIPRSAAMPTTVAPGVIRYSSTASRRNSSEYVFLATV